MQYYFSSPCGQCSRWMLSARAPQPMLTSAWRTSLHPNSGLLFIFMSSMSLNQTVSGPWGFLFLIPSRSLGVKPNSVPSSGHLADTEASALTSTCRDMEVAEEQNGKHRYILFNEMNSCVKSMATNG